VILNVNVYKYERQNQNMITQNEFEKIIVEMDTLEGRAPFYRMSTNLYNHGFKEEAYLLLLSTWNFAYFRYIVNAFEINQFREMMDSLENDFKALENCTIETANLDEHKDRIVRIFNRLSCEKGSDNQLMIGPTGASKIMHLRLPSFFIMWDRYISGQEAYKWYETDLIIRCYYEIGTMANGRWRYKRYTKDGEGYFGFLKDMKKLFIELSHLHVPKFSDMSMAKHIDTFNYVVITRSIQQRKKQSSNKRKRLIRIR